MTLQNLGGQLIAMKRKFQYVFWLPAKKVWVIYRRGYGRTGRCYQTQDDAVKDAAQLLGTDMASLALKEQTRCAAPEPRKFQRVYWDCLRRLWQVKRKGHVFTAYASSQEAAAKLAAKEFGMRVHRMKLRPRTKKTQKQCKSRKYRFVYFDRRDKFWRVRRKGFNCAAGFPTELAAAKFAAETFNETLSTLAAKTRQCLSMRVQAERFQGLWSLYHTTTADHPLLPGDVQDLLQRASALRSLKRFPGLIVPLLMTKYGPHRDILLDIVQQQQHLLEGSQQDTIAEAKWLHGVLLGAVQPDKGRPGLDP